MAEFKCPHCHAVAVIPGRRPPLCECGCVMQRVWKPVSVIYKGTGFYTTDNRSAE